MKKRLYEIQYLLTHGSETMTEEGVHRLKAEKIMLEKLSFYKEIKN